jgi:predicted aspartyl protease
MPITPWTFTGLKALSSTYNYRAYADVVVMNSAGARKSSTIQCLVDTGSDYTILPMSIATAVGITPTGPPITFRTANGASYTLPSHPSVDLIVEGYHITVFVVFSSAAAFTPILGRLELVTAFDIGLDTTNWYWD